MRTKVTIIATAIIMLAQISSATVWRVNNRVNSDPDFTTTQAAHNGASAGDTLYIEGSPNGYGNLNCSKQLHIIGAGDFLNENDSTQAYKEVSRIGQINFNAGSENSIVEGCRFENNRIDVNTSEITIRRNKIQYTGTGGNANYYAITIASNCTNVLIENNYILMNYTYVYARNFGIYSDGGTGLTNLVIRNNFIYTRHTTYYTGYSIYLSSTILAENVTIYQNVFSGNDASNAINAKETQFYNNIMIIGTYYPNGSYYYNNIGNGTQFGSANGNQENIDMSTVFIDYTTGIDSDMQLAAGSPAIGAGWAGEDCGMYGGDHPWVLSLFPAIPAIWDVSLNNYGSNNVTIDVNIKAKSHN
ncbi:MAG: hypothetical protein JXA03_14040 [Bacteroidales bacterium]|nr:hypothetical protein [Bacteroidales bacterium]